MKLTLYKLEIGHDITYSESFEEQYKKYKQSGDNWKNIIKMKVNITPELVCSMLEGHDPTDFYTEENTVEEWQMIE